MVTDVTSVPAVVLAPAPNATDPLTLALAPVPMATALATEPMALVPNANALVAVACALSPIAVELFPLALVPTLPIAMRSVNTEKVFPTSAPLETSVESPIRMTVDALFAVAYPWNRLTTACGVDELAPLVRSPIPSGWLPPSAVLVLDSIKMPPFEAQVSPYWVTPSVV